MRAFILLAVVLVGCGGQPSAEKQEALPPVVTPGIELNQSPAVAPVMKVAVTGTDSRKILYANSFYKDGANYLDGGRTDAVYDVFVVLLNLVNESQTKIVDYHGFADRRHVPKLADEFGNFYKTAHLPGYRIVDYRIAGKHVADQCVHDLRVRPGESTTDVLVFEKPLAKAQRLVLTLPAAAWGEKGEVVLSVGD